MNILITRDALIDNESFEKEKNTTYQQLLRKCKAVY